MPEWLENTLPAESEFSPLAIAARLLLATVCGLMVAAIGHATHGRRKPDAAMFLATLVLLTVLIAMVTLVIGNSVARAFGLVGALSIVRFRTVVDDTRDTAFVIFAVIVGMAIGAGAWLVPAIGIPLIACLAVGLDRRLPKSFQQVGRYNLTVRIGLGRDPEELLNPIFNQHLAEWTVLSAGTARNGAVVELVCQVAFPGSARAMELPKFAAVLNRVEGVQSVDIARV